MPQPPEDPDATTSSRVAVALRGDDTSMGAAPHYRAYRARSFTRAERDTVTILFGGLHWRAERVLEAVFANLGYQARALPPATKEDLLAGREVADIGQCCPTSFTTGNLVNFLRAEARRTGPDQVANRYVYVTAGSCGACRFGQYHQSYELALRNTGLEQFRMFLLAQDRMEQGAARGDGLEINVPFTTGALWAALCTDVLQNLEYQVRPYEVVPGETDRVVADSVAQLAEAFRRRPLQGTRWGTLAWHLTTGYFTRALREIHRGFGAIEVDRLRVKPVVKITGEFYLQTVEGEPNYNIHRWLEGEGAEVYPAAVATWLDYWMRWYAQGFEDHLGIDRLARFKIGAVKALQAVFRWTYNRFRAALGDLPHDLPDQYELRRLAAPYFNSRLSGGEGDMLVGKALWAYHHKRAHMICELSPYACMPNTMSVGAMAGVLGRYPDLLYAPLEIKGDAEVHALSRCQMILTEAKRRAQQEFEATLERYRLTVTDVVEYLDAHPEMKRATHPLHRRGGAGTAAALVATVATRLGRTARGTPS
jgi:predicted nucleotide-binding protein (sugar kinase/HSP70/actin superfamily)